MYIYNLPYLERKTLCRILDVNNAWEQLGGAHMNFDVTTLQHFRQAPVRSNSPTWEMLTLWGTQNHTVLELFILLSKMQHYQAMMVLKPMVEEKYHQLIYEGEENFSRIFAKNNIIHKQEKDDHGNEINGNLNVNLNNQDGPSGKNFKRNKADKVLLGVYGNVEGQPRKAETLLSEGLSPSIPYAELERATGSWDKKNLLGKGGFGTVYKGFWKNTDVAIKRLEVQKGEDMDETFRTNRKQSLQELKCLNSCRHDNILPLYGYSIGGPHDCLVYQYMTNGSLEDRLLCKEGTKPLTWTQRHSIATGTARGLQYLHTIGDKPLIHGDIKSANILLDPYLVPKIGDFGLAREGPLQQYTHVKVSRVHGTRPYLPDEFLRAKKFSTKVDTFSFGVVLFELATGLRAYDDSRTYKYLKEHVESVSDELINQLRDSKAGNDSSPLFLTLISMGRWCVSAKAKDRPEMVEVLQKLDVTISDTNQRISVSPNKALPFQVPQNSASTARRSSYNNMEPIVLPPQHPDTNMPLVANPGPSNYISVKRTSNESLDDSFESPSMDSSYNSSDGNIDRPVIKIEPPSSPASSVNMSAANRDATACNDLPLISALGINTENLDDGDENPDD